ncbi:copper amine oxidase N-terminal domain-containing protein [Schinkia azotoformans]|uniref:copper amine oxidase N-terminal domain-containing protein n=1 Tax=Schinkia azotoformans TaxID=1454 RepID=UPI002DB81847|nr:copper amine oxidase N-terminal domain-containing protein [Schinkia azotoformans]MEC1697899.1 copper amine oxidase N-terminal domain-containing protein [Schinkia azotoformans]MEC1725127.1 copper amine oxidase N-terminal domain-containing protein [Schinkia azotoformans]MEC1781252.1 copper amine oxidase N-terminal domain-containing protein [Schinkia azotoformans]MED4330588.1 copper amine oxidase N-terminal domain-containing protein [Schinkia azotoformans]
MKSFIALVVIVFLTTLTGSFVSAKEKITLDNGLLVEGQAVVPLRSIFQTIGADVKWDNVEQKVIASKDTTVVNLRINEEEVLVNGKLYDLDAPIRMIEGQTMVPVRLLEIAFGADIKWDSKINVVTIKLAEKEVNVVVKEYTEEISIKISAASDITLGGDANASYQGAKVDPLLYFILLCYN